MKILFFKEGKKMSKKKKIFILVSMVLLLVVTGYLNIALNRSNNKVETTTTTANFFTSSRADYLAARNYQLEIYDNIIKTSANQDEIIETKAKRDALLAKMDEELVLETYISARGYDDVIVKMVDDTINVFVKTENGLTSDEVASILSILVRETGCLATQVRVTPIK